MFRYDSNFILFLKGLSNQNMVNQKLEVKSDIYDVLVIGAGPHSLAVCSRLLERNPSAIYTDLEHSRLSWLHKYKRLSYHPKGFKRKLLNNKNDLEGLKMIALDKHNSGGWMVSDFSKKHRKILINLRQ